MDTSSHLSSYLSRPAEEGADGRQKPAAKPSRRLSLAAT
jgi:hypothetical protein